MYSNFLYYVQDDSGQLLVSKIIILLLSIMNYYNNISSLTYYLNSFISLKVT